MYEADQLLLDELRKERVDQELIAKRQAFQNFQDLLQSRAEGTVVRFSKAFATGGIEYSYAAIKANGQWYTTGPKGSHYSDDEFALWLIHGPEAAKNFIVMEMPDEE